VKILMFWWRCNHFKKFGKLFLSLAIFWSEFSDSFLFPSGNPGIWLSAGVTRVWKRFVVCGIIKTVALLCPSSHSIEVLYWVTSSIPHASRLNLSMHRSNMENANTWRRGYIHGGSREYTLDGANTFTLMKHKLLRHTHERRHHAYYNVVLRW